MTHPAPPKYLKMPKFDNFSTMKKTTPKWGSTVKTLTLKKIYGLPGMMAPGHFILDVKVFIVTRVWWIF